MFGLNTNNGRAGRLGLKHDHTVDDRHHVGISADFDGDLDSVSVGEDSDAIGHHLTAGDQHGVAHVHGLDLGVADTSTNANRILLAHSRADVDADGFANSDSVGNRDVCDAARAAYGVRDAHGHNLAGHSVNVPNEDAHADGTDADDEHP